MKIQIKYVSRHNNNRVILCNFIGMAKESKSSKKRSDKYEEKVSFDGTFEDLISITVKDAEKRVQGRKNAEKVNSTENQRNDNTETN